MLKSFFSFNGKFKVLSVFYTLLRERLLDLFLRAGLEREEYYMKEPT